jgi:hypothetical protein
MSLSRMPLVVQWFGNSLLPLYYHIAFSLPGCCNWSPCSATCPFATTHIDKTYVTMQLDNMASGTRCW